MTEHERWVAETLLQLTRDVGSVKSDVGEIKGTVQSLPCPTHSETMHSLRTEIARVDSKVDTRVAAVELKVDGVDQKIVAIHTKDLPAIRESLAVIGWFNSSRRKVLGVVFVAAIGLLGSVLGGIILSKINASSATAAPIPSIASTPSPIPPAAALPKP